MDTALDRDFAGDIAGGQKTESVIAVVGRSTMPSNEPSSSTNEPFAQYPALKLYENDKNVKNIASEKIRFHSGEKNGYIPPPIFYNAFPGKGLC